jgi:hypothetical protein
MTTNDFFKKIIKRHNILGIQAADMCERDASTVSLYLSSNRKMPLKVLQKFMDKFNIFVNKKYDLYQEDLINFENLLAEERENNERY